MKLEDIGFYTLNDKRAWHSSRTSPLWRCEMILTDRCTFKCPYCRGMRPELQGDMGFNQAKTTVRWWISEGLKHVRFTGGEPTLYEGLEELIAMCKRGGVNRIALSTNGYSDLGVYQKLLEAGVDDLSISLDGGCCSTGDKMSGGVEGSWDKVISNVKALVGKVYLTLGMVFNEENIDESVGSVIFADSLGASDIRVIPSAQYNKVLERLATLPSEILAKYPLLRYRIDNAKKGRNIRGLTDRDCSRCWLVLDDMAVAGKYHFPCIVYLREGGDPIGEIGDNVREARYRWAWANDTKSDPICSKSCLDICIDYNNKARMTHGSGDANWGQR